MKDMNILSSNESLLMRYFLSMGSDEFYVNYSSLRKATGIKSPVTLKKYLMCLSEKGYIEFDGGNRRLGTMVSILSSNVPYVGNRDDIVMLNERLDKCARYIVQLERRISALEEKK